LPLPAVTPDPEAVTVPDTSFPEPAAESAEPSEQPPDPQPPIAQAPAEPPVPEPIAVEPAPEPVAVAPTQATEPVRDLPPTGSISFEVFMGAGRFHIGRTVQTWEIGAQTYRLSSVSQTTGLVGFFRPNQLSYFTEGQVDASGFRPELFLVRRGRDGARQYGARFNWAAKELTLGSASDPRKVALPAGTLDVLSLIFQLVRSPLAPGRFQLNITTGNKLDVYTLDVGTEENIEAPLGTIRTVPVRQVRTPGQESIEIWFAPERQYLPVRIRFLDRNGELSGEQIAADIASENQ
jgi:hypothetical protein